MTEAATRLRRPFSQELKRAFDRVNIPYHPDLIQDFETIVKLVKTKQGQFLKNPYSSAVFEDYAKVCYL